MTKQIVCLDPLMTHVNKDSDCTALRKLILPYLMDPMGWRFHGIGMLQKYITINESPDGDARVHVWHPSLFHFEDEESNHDHRFDLRSHILHGRILHIESTVEEDETGTHVMWDHGNQDIGGQDHPQMLPGLWRIRERPMEISAGSVYTFPQGYFHRTKVDELTITLIFRGPRRGRSRALFPVGVTARHGMTVRESEDVISSLLADAIKVLSVHD